MLESGVMGKKSRFLPTFRESWVKFAPFVPTFSFFFGFLERAVHSMKTPPRILEQSPSGPAPLEGNMHKKVRFSVHEFGTYTGKRLFVCTFLSPFLERAVNSIETPSARDDF